jgi:hypothetical protein
VSLIDGNPNTSSGVRGFIAGILRRLNWRLRVADAKVAAMSARVKEPGRLPSNALYLQARVGLDQVGEQSSKYDMQICKMFGGLKTTMEKDGRSIACTICRPERSIAACAKSTPSF